MRRTATTTPEPVAGLTATLSEALRALADAGRAEAACEIAGHGYAALRREHPTEAQQINALMHRLVRMSNTQARSKR